MSAYRIKNGVLEKYTGKDRTPAIPDGVTTIGDDAFWGCSSLTGITIPDSVTSIGWFAFSGCSSLTGITIPDSVTSIGRLAFSGCSSLTSIAIPDSVTSIGEYAFSGCSSLTSITIPDSVTDIGEHAFFGCSSLTSIAIPDSVTTIGYEAFSGCSSLTSIAIPDSVTSIGEHAFFGCSSLTSITIPDSVTTIGYEAFSGCSSLTSIAIPDSVTTIGGGAFSGCSSMTSITIPDSVTSIGQFAFSRCWGLADQSGMLIIKGTIFDCKEDVTSIVIPDTVTTIGYCAFIGCSRLTGITIPDSVTTIGDKAFCLCSSLTSITIPDSVTTIGDEAFSGCSSLTSITIPDSVTSIGYWTFKGCSSLTSITIPGSVTAISKEAFSACRALKCVDISADTLKVCKDLTIWETVIKETENGTKPPALLLAAIKKCPKKLQADAEAALLSLSGLEIVAYFEKEGKLERYAAHHNTDADTLRDSVLSDFGLDAAGCRRWQLAGTSLVAKLQKDLTLTLSDSSGKPLKSVPKKGADPAEYDRVKKEFAQLKKDIIAAAKLRNQRLLSDWLTARPRTAEAWKSTYQVNPMLKALARLVVWQQGRKTFLLNDEGLPVDVSGAPVTLTEGEITLAHPMEMGPELTEQWQNYFISRQLAQPFAQVWEPVLDGAAIRPGRYAGASIPLHMLMNKEKHGITMEGQSKLVLRDCEAKLRLVQGHHDWVNNEFEITDFRFKKFTRAVNHIAAHFDKGTVEGRLLKDDTTAVQWLDYFTLAQITAFIAKVTEKGDCPNSTAALLNYKHEKYPEAAEAAFADFVLDW